MTPSIIATQHRTIDSSSLVRKSVSNEALVTGWHSLSENSQVVTARWPQHHPFYIEDDRYSALLATESLRQALALLTHTAHDIPLTHRLGWEQLRTTVNPHALLVTSEPTEVELTITHTDVKRRRLGSTHITSEVEVVRAGQQLGTATLRYSTHPPAIYDRLRGRYADAKDAFSQAIDLTAPVPASSVGRSDEHNVVLSPTLQPHRWQLRVDTSHQVLFDHPHDHVPGMVLLEAASQAALAEAAPEPMVLVALDTTFKRYVEFDQPCLITAKSLPHDAEDDRQIEVQAHQAGHLVFTGSVTTRRRYRADGPRTA